MSEGALPDWGSFCDEQAQKLSDCFKEELRQFRLKNPQYNDVPTAGFARLFTASFLTYFEESSSLNTVDNHNAAAASATLTPSTHPPRQRAWKSIFRKNKDGDKEASGEGSRPPRRRSNTLATSAVARTSPVTNNSATLAGATLRGPTVEQQQSVATPVMSANMNMLQFNQSSDNFENLNWCRCHVTLSLVHGMYQLLIRCPPKTAQPKMSLFCFLITSVRPTSHVEVPDCSSSFVVKAKGSVEYVFDAKSKEAMQSWVEAISRYAGIQSDNELTSLSNNNFASHNEAVTDNTSRSPDSTSRRGRDHMMEFTPLFTQGVQNGSSSPPVPSRTHRSNSLGTLDIPPTSHESVTRRISDSSGQGRNSTLATSPASSQLCVPTPTNVPTVESQDDITTAVSPDPVLSTEHSLSTRSLNTSFIDGPPPTDADDDSDASGDCSPQGSPTTGGGSPLPSLEPGVDPDGLRQYPWFHGMISRIDAALLVTRHGNNGTGEYLIRQSESRAGDLVLSFNYHGRAKHLRLSISPNGTCRVQHLEFRNILHMLEHFKNHPIPLEAPGTTADIQLTEHLPVGTPVPNLPGVRMEPLGRTSSSASNLRSNTLSTDSFHTRSLSVRHNGRTNNSNGNVYVLT